MYLNSTSQALSTLSLNPAKAWALAKGGDSASFGP